MKPKSLPFIAFEHKRCVPSFTHPATLPLPPRFDSFRRVRAPSLCSAVEVPAPRPRVLTYEHFFASRGSRSVAALVFFCWIFFFWKCGGKFRALVRAHWEYGHVHESEEE